MSTDEDYLDQLLHAVTENYREEQGITEEPKPEVGEKFVSNPEAVLTSEPLVEHAPQPEIMPETIPEPMPEMMPEGMSESMPEPEQEPETGQTPIFDAQDYEGMTDLPEMGEMPADMGMPEMGEMPADMAMPEMGEMPVDMGMSEMGEMPADMGMPEMGEMPVDMAMPEMGEMPVDMGMSEMGEMPADMAMPEMGEMPADMMSGMEEYTQDEFPSAMEALNAIQNGNIPEEAAMPEDTALPEGSVMFEEEPVPEQEPMPAEEAMPMEEPMPEEPAADGEPAAFVPSDDPNHVMTPEEIAALVGGSAGPTEEEPAAEESVPVEEPMPEEPAAAGEPAAFVPSDDPNHVMTPEEIAALVGGSEGPTEEEPAAEEPVPEEPAAAEEPAAFGPSDDPNHIMTPEEIAALVGGSAGPTEEESVPADEPAAAGEPAAFEPSDDPNHIMTPEEIAALVGGSAGPTEEEPAAEEPAAEEAIPMDEPVPVEEAAAADNADDPNHTMSPEEIEAMFASAENAAAGEGASGDDSGRDTTFTLNEADSAPIDLGDMEEPSTSDILGDLGLSTQEAEDADVTDIINDMPADAELSEINDLLIKNDNSEMVEDDLLSMLGGGSEDVEGNTDEENDNTSDGDGEEASADEEGAEKKGRKRKEKKKKKTKEVELDEQGNPIKKKGFIARIAEFLFSGDDEDDEEQGKTGPAVAEDGTLVVNPSEQTLENNEVLREVGEEEEGGKKKKKKKEKKPKVKKEKKPKVKKEKKPKPEEPEVPEKKLPKKKVIAVALFFTAFLAAITFCTFAFANIGYESAAKTNYQKGDYAGAYESLTGLDHISAESQDIFNKSFVLMRLQRRIDAFNEYEQREETLGAIDSLIEGVRIRDGLTEYAASLGVGAEFEGLYGNILQYLSELFGVDEARARELYGISDDVEYTMALMDIVDPSWRDGIQPTVELTEGGQGIEFGEDGITVDNEVRARQNEEAAREGEGMPEESEEGDTAMEGDMPPEEMPEEEAPMQEDTADPSITIAPDDSTVVIPEGTQLQVTPNDSNVQPADNDINGQPLYQFNVKKDANGNYVQQ